MNGQPNGYPTTDNDCTRMGWRELALSGPVDLHVSVAPDADLDGWVVAFCHDEQEVIRVALWNFTFEEVAA